MHSSHLQSDQEAQSSSFVNSALVNQASSVFTNYSALAQQNSLGRIYTPELEHSIGEDEEALADNMDAENERKDIDEHQEPSTPADDEPQDISNLHKIKKPRLE